VIGPLVLTQENPDKMREISPVDVALIIDNGPYSGRYVKCLSQRQGLCVKYSGYEIGRIPDGMISDLKEAAHSAHLILTSTPGFLCCHAPTASSTALLKEGFTPGLVKFKPMGAFSHPSR